MKLRKHQIEALQDLRENDRFAVFMDCGGGKTVLTLERIKELKGNVTLITPKQLIKSVWIAEIKKFNYNFNVQIVNKKDDALKEADIYIHTPDYLRSKNYCGVITPYLIVDEASSFKNYNSQRTKILTKNAHKYEKIVLLTATPCPRDLTNLFSLIRILDGGERLGKYITQFRNNYCYQIMENVYKIRNGVENIILDKIKDIAKCYEIDNEKLPFINNIVNIDMKPKYLKAYNQFKGDDIYIINEKTIASFNTGKKFATLRQLATGYIRDDEKIIDISNHKVERLLMMLQDMETCLLFINFNYEIDMIVSQLKNISYAIINGQTKNIDEIVNKWNNKEIQLLIANPVVAGKGLNLQKGGHQIIWFSPTFDLEAYYQANRRLLRSGQNKTVIINNLCTNNTVEADAYNTIIKKQYTQEKALKELQ